MQKPIITTKDVDITYNAGKSNEYRALNGVSVDIYAREYVILFGPSGCGKSTLLYSMFGVLPPTRGKIYVKGDSVYDLTPMELVHFQRKTMGIMYQSFNLIASISVIDNVTLPLIFAGVSKKKREKKAWELLKRFGIDGVAHKVPTNLSGGQQQRVSVARSLVNDPEILIADEPVGNLDSISAEAVMNTLSDINEQDKKTILLVTHDAKHLPYAHRVMYLKEGYFKKFVVNPDMSQVLKAQPGSTIMTEIEQIQRIYPYDSPAQLRVKGVINYLTQELTFDQILRLEKMVGIIMSGNMNDMMFYQVLTREYNRGGVGVPENIARDMASKISRILDHSQDIMRYRRKNTAGATIAHNNQVVRNITHNILKEFDVMISDVQRENLEVLIAKRISGYIKKNEYKELLLTAVDKGGVGLNERTMHSTTRYLEKLIAQGVHGSSKGEE